MFIKEMPKEEAIDYRAVPGLLNDYRLTLKSLITSHGLQDILNLVSEETGIRIIDIKRQIRKREIVIARQIYFYMVKKYTSHSLVQIGNFLKRDHTTVIHSITTIKNLMDTDHKIKESIERLENKVRQIKHGIDLKYEVIGKTETAS